MSQYKRWPLINFYTFKKGNPYQEMKRWIQKGIHQFLRQYTQIWNRGQFFQKKTTHFKVRIKIGLKQGVKTSKNGQKTTFLSDSSHYIFLLTQFWSQRPVQVIVVIHKAFRNLFLSFRIYFFHLLTRLLISEIFPSKPDFHLYK